MIGGHCIGNLIFAFGDSRSLDGDDAEGPNCAT